MKQITNSILVLAFILCLYNCDNNNTPSNTNSNNKPNLSDSTISSTLPLETKSNSINYQLKDSLHLKIDSVIIVGGIIQSIGVSEQYKFNLDIDARFQLISLKESYYLISEEQLNKFWGQCMAVKGTLLKDGTSQNPHQFQWGRLALQIDSLWQIPNQLCFDSPKLRLKENKSLIYSKILSGFIARHQRPAPDIGMDYLFHLDTGLQSPDDTSVLLTELPFYPDFSLSKLNEVIEHKTPINAYGNLAGGYADLIIFECDSIQISQ